jgi:L-rhamnose-H+ transport protein
MGDSYAVKSGAVVFSFMMILFGSAMNGAYAIPIRFMRRWRWENIWALWTILALILLPSITAFCSLSSLWRTYSQTSWMTFLWMAAFGLLWGTGVLILFSAHGAAWLNV